MIEWLRKHMVWMMWIIVGLITVTFLFFGVYPSSQGGRVAAKVGDYVISSDDVNQAYRNLYDNYRELLKDKFTPEIEKSLRAQALQELIVNRLLVEEAGRLGLTVSDEELQTAILNMPGFSRNGRFDKQVYDGILSRINMTPAVFEAKQREFIMREKLERLVRDSVVVEDSELKAAYLTKNPTAKTGDFEKNREAFRQTILAEKQRDALNALIKNIQNRIPVTVDKKGLA